MWECRRLHDCQCVRQCGCGCADVAGCECGEAGGMEDGCVCVMVYVSLWWVESCCVLGGLCMRTNFIVSTNPVITIGIENWPVSFFF